MAEEEKDVLTEETLINEILSELKIELEVESEQDILLLQSKIKGAVREVKQKRNYAGRYTEEYVVNDLQNYISNIKNLAMYDYGMIGGEFQKSNSDNGISVSWESRDSVLAGVVPIAQVYLGIKWNAWRFLRISPYVKQGGIYVEAGSDTNYGERCLCESS